MNAQHKEVQNWLEKVYAGDSVPQYEISQRNVEILYELMQRHEWQDKTAEILLQDLQQKTEEYSLEADRTANILQQMGLTPSTLSQSGTGSLRSLASIASLLEIKDASTTNYLLAMSEYSQTGMRLKEARRAEQKVIKQLFTKTKTALQRCNTLNKVYEGLEEQIRYQGPELSNKAKQAGFLQSKAREYKKNIQQLQLEITQSGTDPSIYHSALLKKSEALKEIKENLQPLKAKLDSYHKLPPDMSLAKVKVEEAKHELSQLEEELSKHIDLMHL